MGLQYGMEEAAKHPVSDGKSVHKSVPRIAEYRRVVGLSALDWRRSFAFGVAIHSETLAKQAPPSPSRSTTATGVVFPALEPCKEMKPTRDI